MIIIATTKNISKQLQKVREEEQDVAYRKMMDLRNRFKASHHRDKLNLEKKFKEEMAGMQTELQNQIMDLTNENVNLKHELELSQARLKDAEIENGNKRAEVDSLKSDVRRGFKAYEKYCTEAIELEKITQDFCNEMARLKSLGAMFVDSSRRFESILDKASFINRQIEKKDAKVLSLLNGGEPSDKTAKG